MTSDREAILASVFTASLDCIVVIDDQGHVLEFNPAAEKTFGYSRAQVLGRPIADLIIPSHHRAAHAHGFARYLGGGEPRVIGHRVEVEAMRSDGTIFPVELAISEVAALQGKKRFTASLRDLSDRRATEAALRDSEARLTALLDHAPLTMYLKDRNGHYCIANRFMAQQLGKTVEELKHLTPQDVLTPASAEEAAAVDRQIIETRQPHVRESEFMSVEGPKTAVTVRFPVFGDDGEINYIGGVFLDITEQKRAQHELARSREALAQREKLTALGSLLAGVSHELNNPLAVVVGEAILLEEDAEGTEFAASAVRIRKSAERCSRIVQTFLAMARQRPPQRAEVDVGASIRAALELTEYAMRSNGISVNTDITPELPPVLADSDQLHQVIVNLLINAQQALQECDPPRAITASARRHTSGDRVCIEVADNGPGIPPEVAKRIFEPFFTTKPQGAGTGIGLSFSHGVVAAHGGSLSLKSGEGGATFLVELPVDEGQPALEKKVEEPVPLTTARGSALIVDDEPDLAEALARFLQREGFESIVVNSGREAIELCQSGQYDVILSDLRMPEMDGAAF